MKISMKDLKAIGKNLDKRQPPRLAENIAQDLSLKEIVTTLAPSLLQMKNRGITTDGMVAALKDNKINIDGKTLNRYLNDYKASRKESVPDEAAKPATAESSARKDGFTPKEETPSEQPGPQVTARPDPLKELI